MQIWFQDKIPNLLPKQVFPNRKLPPPSHFFVDILKSPLVESDFSFSVSHDAW